MVDERTDYWMPMDQYIGGIEHAVLHLLYSRFWTKVMRDLGLVKFDEPFKQPVHAGHAAARTVTTARMPAARSAGSIQRRSKQQFDERGMPISAVAMEDGKPVIYGGIEKMSKSKNNVVEPGAFIERFGADTARAFVMFAGPPDQSAPWSDASAEGVHRFLRRSVVVLHEHARADRGRAAVGMAQRSTAGLKKIRRELHATLQQALFDFQRMQYNTVVSATMKMLNALDGVKSTPGGGAVLREGLGILLRTLYPIAPHVTHALWVELGFATGAGRPAGCADAAAGAGRSAAG